MLSCVMIKPWFLFTAEEVMDPFPFALDFVSSLGLRTAELLAHNDSIQTFALRDDQLPAWLQAAEGGHP